MIDPMNPGARETFATKADLEALRIATKTDLVEMEGRLATKEDLQALEARMMSTLATKAEFKRLAVDQGRLHGRFDSLEDKLTRLISKGNSRIMKTVEDFAVETRKIDRREIITSGRVTGLEKRVSVLETR